MTTLIEVRTTEGTARRCDASCHYAKGEKGECTCVCQGKFHGIKSDAEAMSWEEVDATRQQIDLDEGETIQLRIGV